MKIKVNIPRQFIAVIIVIYAMLYEWRSICEINSFLPFVNIVKTIVPLLLLVFMLKLRVFSIKYHPCKNYLFFFILFMCWGFCSSVFSIEPQECIVQWLKFIFLLGFCYLICAYLLTSEAAHKRLMRIFIAVAIFTVAQYILLQIITFCGLMHSFNLPTNRGGIYCGPFGILGQGSGNVYFKSLGFSLYRIYGFWLEPSAAAGFLLASAFFAEAVFLQTKEKIWKIAKFVCFTGSVAAFSNTAYLCIGMARLLEELFCLKTNRNRRYFHSITALFFITLIFFAIFGRYFVAKYYADNIDLRYVAGVRDSVENPYGGRVELFKSNLVDTKTNPLLGLGFRIPGKNKEGRGYAVSSFALGYWIAFTGIIGIMLLMLRELQIISVIAKNIFSSVYILRVSQAWLALFIAHLSYGTLMNPFYFITVAIVFSSIYHFKERGNIE